MALSVAVLLKEALQFQQKGRPANAKRLYRRALAFAPENFDALYLLGMPTIQQCKLDEAAGSASSAVQHNPASAEALILLGSILAMTGRFDEARFCSERAIGVQPKTLDAPMIVTLRSVRRDAYRRGSTDARLRAQYDGTFR